MTEQTPILLTDMETISEFCYPLINYSSAQLHPTDFLDTHIFSYSYMLPPKSFSTNHAWQHIKGHKIYKKLFSSLHFHT